MSAGAVLNGCGGRLAFRTWRPRATWKSG